MLMAKFKICTAFILCLIATGMIGCGESPQQLFETARFEELQNNQSHARELYEQIIQKHPNSDFAKKAVQRLGELKKTAPK